MGYLDNSFIFKKERMNSLRSETFYSSAVLHNSLSCRMYLEINAASHSPRNAIHSTSRIDHQMHSRQGKESDCREFLRMQIASRGSNRRVDLL